MRKVSRDDAIAAPLPPLNRTMRIRVNHTVMARFREGDESLQMIGVEDIVVIKVGYVLSASCTEAGIASGGSVSVGGVLNISDIAPDIEWRDKILNVHTTIIDNDDFKVAPGLAEDTLQRFG